MDVVGRIAEAVRARPPPGQMTTRIVAVDGLGGAGKSTLAARLSQELGVAPVLQTDDFASWDEPLEWWPRLLADVLQPLARNEACRFPRSSWGPGHPTEWREVAPADFLIFEGVSSSREAFRPFLTYAVWVETPRELRLRRGLERDGEEARAQWERWMAEEEAWVERERPRERADAAVRGDVAWS